MLLNFTNLGVTAKLSGPSGLVWVTRLSDGQPQPGAEVSIRDAQGQGPLARHDRRRRAGRDARQRAAAPKTSGPAQPPPPRRARRRRRRRRRRRATASTARATSWARGRGPAGVRAARQGHDLGQPRSHGRPGGVELPRPRRHLGARRAAARLHAHRSRPVPPRRYRARKGLARVMKLGGAARAVVAQGARRRARSARRAAAGEERRRSAASAASRSTCRSARGRASATTASRPSMADGVFHERFSVEQYRAASFEVKVPPPAREPVAGEELKLTAEARYLYGAPLRGGALTWRVYRRSRARQLPEAAGVRLLGRAAVAELDRLAVGGVGAAGRGERAAPGQERPREAVADAEEGGLPVGAGHHGHRRGPGRDAPDDRRERRDPRPPGRASTSASTAAARSARRRARARSSSSRSTRRATGSPPTARSRCCATTGPAPGRRGATAAATAARRRTAR